MMRKGEGGLLDRFHIFENVLGMPIDAFAQRSEVCAFFSSLQQRLAHFLFQFFNLMTECRLADVAKFSRRHEAAVVGHGHEIAKLMEFNRQYLWSR